MSPKNIGIIRYNNIYIYIHNIYIYMYIYICICICICICMYTYTLYTYYVYIYITYAPLFNTFCMIRFAFCWRKGSTVPFVSFEKSFGCLFQTVQS